MMTNENERYTEPSARIQARMVRSAWRQVRAALVDVGLILVVAAVVVGVLAYEGSLVTLLGAALIGACSACLLLTVGDVVDALALVVRVRRGTVRPMERAVVALCGSTRHMDAITEVAAAETLAGRLVLRPEVDMRTHPAGADSDAAAVKRRLDALHRVKIEWADEVIVVCPGGYVGESTAAEVAYARQLGRPVSYTEPPALVGVAAELAR